MLDYERFKTGFRIKKKMKLLFYRAIVWVGILAVTIKISKTDETLNNLVKNISSISETLKEDIDDFLELLQEVGVEGIPYSPFFYTYIKGRSDIEELEKNLTKNPFLNLSKLCGFEEKIKTTNSKLEEMSKLALNQKAEDILDKNEKDIDSVKKEVSDIEQALKNNLDQELKKCNSSDPSCIVSDKVLTRLQEKLSQYEELHLQLLYERNHVRENLDSNEISNLISAQIIQPVMDCLEKNKERKSQD